MRARAAGIVIGATMLAGPVLAQHLDGGPFSGAKLHPKSQFAAAAQDAAATAPSPAAPADSAPPVAVPPKSPGAQQPSPRRASVVPTLDRLSPGNRRIALALAKESLERRGIDHPTREQLRQALRGDAGKAGILELRARGMGWGEIAHSLGFKLGDAMRHDGKHGHKHKHHARHDHKHKHHARHDHKRHDWKPDHKGHDWKHERRHHGHIERVHRVEKPEKHHRPNRPERFERPRHRD